LKYRGWPIQLASLDAFIGKQILRWNSQTSVYFQTLGTKIELIGDFYFWDRTENRNLLVNFNAGEVLF
jgi:hypothetical protein